MFQSGAYVLGAGLVLGCIGGVVLALIVVCMLGYEFCVKSCINRCKKQSSSEDNNNDEKIQQQQVRNSSVLLFNNYFPPVINNRQIVQKAHQQCRGLMIVLWIQQLSYRERL